MAGTSPHYCWALVFPLYGLHMRGGTCCLATISFTMGEVRTYWWFPLGLQPNLLPAVNSTFSLYSCASSINAVARATWLLRKRKGGCAGLLQLRSSLFHIPGKKGQHDSNVGISSFTNKHITTSRAICACLPSRRAHLLAQFSWVLLGHKVLISWTMVALDSSFGTAFTAPTSPPPTFYIRTDIFLAHKRARATAPPCPPAVWHTHTLRVENNNTTISLMTIPWMPVFRGPTARMHGCTATPHAHSLTTPAALPHVRATHHHLPPHLSFMHTCPPPPTAVPCCCTHCTFYPLTYIRGRAASDEQDHLPTSTEHTSLSMLELTAW